jgi:hypothetical protein
LIVKMIWFTIIQRSKANLEVPTSNGSFKVIKNIQGINIHYLSSNFSSPQQSPLHPSLRTKKPHNICTIVEAPNDGGNVYTITAKKRTTNIIIDALEVDAAEVSTSEVRTDVGFVVVGSVVGFVDKVGVVVVGFVVVGVFVGFFGLVKLGLVGFCVMVGASDVDAFKEGVSEVSTSDVDAFKVGVSEVSTSEEVGTTTEVGA